MFDITDKDSIRNAVATVEKNDGKLDILVNKCVYFLSIRDMMNVTDHCLLVPELTAP